MSKNKSFLEYLSLLTQLGLVMVISILLGLFTGLFIDRKFNLEGIFTIIFLIFGVIGGFMAAYKLIANLD